MNQMKKTPLNISPWSHSITVDMDFNCYPTDNLNGAYINNAAYYVDKLAAELRDHDMHVIWDGGIWDTYSDGDTLPGTYATDVRPLLFSQLRNGGYRLAAIFNAIFK